MINNLYASYKDPSGFVFAYKNKIYRQINIQYKDDYDLLISSGLYDKLTSDGLLIKHKEVSLPSLPAHAYKIIEPEKIPFISYPYEWCFSQFKDAALLTLQIQKISMDYGMSLKDASSFNIQFEGGKPIFIDTLSFEKYQEGIPWIAYKQFCEQFLSPLALMAHTDTRLNKLLIANLGSIPLDLTVKLLPLLGKFKPALFLHLYLHSRSQKKYATEALVKRSTGSITKTALLGIIDSLESAIRNIRLYTRSDWSTYYGGHEKCFYDQTSFSEKKSLVTKYLQIAKPKTLWDIGANTGQFSRISANLGIFTLSLDIDHDSVEQNYLALKKNKENNILPLWIDIANPTPSLGWANLERSSLLGRPKPDTILALALIHHLCLGGNLPFTYLSEFFAHLTQSLIIEFVPIDDPNAKTLIAGRDEIFTDYNQESFEKEFRERFAIIEKSKISGIGRTLYLLTNKNLL
ncbi:SAM-dependent methyltransferase [Candidatus Roizmanbacteria bacterium]|nr:SAM-dependent methyltransferase [Candidatus Roizmanbacteria bacterium]